MSFGVEERKRSSDSGNESDLYRPRGSSVWCTTCRYKPHTDQLSFRDCMCSRVMRHVYSQTAIHHAARTGILVSQSRIQLGILVATRTDKASLPTCPSRQQFYPLESRLLYTQVGLVGMCPSSKPGNSQIREPAGSKKTRPTPIVLRPNLGPRL